MQNEMKYRLAELMGNQFAELYKDGDWNFNEMLVGVADYLIENGVIVLPCKIGDKVWVIDDCVTHEECCKCEHYLVGYGDPSECNRTRYGEKHIDCIKIVEQTATSHDVLNWITPSIFTEKIMWGETVFLTKEEAEQKLKGGASDE